MQTQTMKWYKKLFFHLVDCATLTHTSCTRAAQGRREHCIISPEVVRQLLEQYSEPRNGVGRRGAANGDDPTRLTGRQFPKTIPATPCEKKKQKPCHVCRTSTQRPKARKDTRYMCVECNIAALCLEPCFEQCHTPK